MFKKGPTEKEKILRHLTEKEIKEQLYSFNTMRVSVAPLRGQVKKEPARKQPQKEQPKNPYLAIQVILLIVFLALIWVSLRQVIKVISRPKKAAVQAQEKKNGMERYRQKKISAR